MPSINTQIVLTIIAQDRPGIVQAVSKTLKTHGGNWTESSMSSLAGHFAGILLASVPQDQAEACIADLHALETGGVRIIAQACDAPEESTPCHTWELELVGNDRPGIVNEITQILERHHVNVAELETEVEAASMGGAELFKARARLLVPETSNIGALETEIEDLANDLMVEIKLVR